jgi:hypothetical protein
VRGAKIGADVERERLAHERHIWRAARWSQASAKVVALSERMQLVTNSAVAAQLRQEAAHEAHALLAAVILQLQDDPAANPDVSRLRETLHRQDLDAAAQIWSRVQSGVLSGRLS